MQHCEWNLHNNMPNKFPELSAKKMDETNALPEPALKLPKMTILLMKIRLFYLESLSFLS